LVWFERYAPYIDECDVPMLHQLLPMQWANVQWTLAVSGLVSMGLALGLANAVLWKTGTALLVASGVVLLAILVKILRDKL